MAAHGVGSSRVTAAPWPWRPWPGSASTELFTLSGGHIFPFYDAAVKQVSPPVRIVDVRHEQTATFAAEGHGQAHPPPGRRRAHRRPRASPTA